MVRLHNFHQLSAPQPCFTFSHPNRGRFLCVCPLRGRRARPLSFFPCCLGLSCLSFPWSCSLPSCLGLLALCHPHNFSLTDPMIDNNRYCTLEFPVEVNTVLHGFAGYFETVLYQDITLSEFGALDGGVWACTTWAAHVHVSFRIMWSPEVRNGNL